MFLSIIKFTFLKVGQSKREKKVSALKVISDINVNSNDVIKNCYFICKTRIIDVTKQMTSKKFGVLYIHSLSV